MTDNEQDQDPARSTQQFRAFAQNQPQPEQVPSGGLPTGLILTVAAATLLILIAILALTQL
ncbi:hypothetical protein GCM10027589_23850 [Actinocorallia lasiicapitis]